MVTHAVRPNTMKKLAARAKEQKPSIGSFLKDVCLQLRENRAYIVMRHNVSIR